MRRWYGIWDYPFLGAEMAEAGFKETRNYVRRRQNTVAQYISTCPLLELCKRLNQRPGAWVSRRWWEQDGLDLD